MQTNLWFNSDCLSEEHWDLSREKVRICGYMSLQRGKQGTICKPHELVRLSARRESEGEQVQVDYDLGDFAGF